MPGHSILQSTSQRKPFPGLHVAIIMDGSGRWAAARGLARSAGHHSGIDAVRRVVGAASGLGIGTLTLFAFSADNWQRPQAEVAGLMRVFEAFLRGEAAALARAAVRLSVVGRRDRLPAALLAAVEAAEAATAGGRAMHLRLAIDYSARDSILRAAGRVKANGELTRRDFERALAEAGHARLPAPEVDLIIRSGGELRLSDLLLWECAYAELVFTPRLWPDFSEADLAAAIQEFRRRARRFGRIPEAAAS